MVQQEDCAMKVCTDACLFGAWVADLATGNRILDIGAGTGLLSLMLAQAYPSSVIDAVEIDHAAAMQATSNAASSPFGSRIRIVAGDIRQFCADPYDLIISNPPFFSNDLRSADIRRNLALHSEALTLEELVQAAGRLLTSNGKLAILLPSHRSGSFEELLERNNFHVSRRTAVRQTSRHDIFRVMYLAGYSREKSVQDEITINSAQFINLLKPYYLFL